MTATEESQKWLTYVAENAPTPAWAYYVCHISRLLQLATGYSEWLPIMGRRDDTPLYLAWSCRERYLEIEFVSSESCEWFFLSRKHTEHGAFDGESLPTDLIVCAEQIGDEYGRNQRNDRRERKLRALGFDAVTEKQRSENRWRHEIQRDWDK